MIRYRHAANDSEAVTSHRAWTRYALKPLLAVAASLIVVVMVQTTLSPPGSDSSAITTDQYNAAVFDEYRALFHDELRAVVARNGDVDVVLGGRQTMQANPLVLLRLETDGAPVYITTYSGQTIEADIGGKTIRMEILTTSDSEVLVASDDFILERGVLYGPDSFRADAHVLETSL